MASRPYQELHDRASLQAIITPNSPLPEHAIHFTPPCTVLHALTLRSLIRSLLHGRLAVVTGLVYSWWMDGRMPHTEILNYGKYIATSAPTGPTDTENK